MKTVYALRAPLALLAALAIGLIPTAPAQAQDDTQVAWGVSLPTKLEACSTAMNAATGRYYNKAQYTRTIGTCECETVTRGYGSDLYRCAVRINLYKK